MWLSYNSEQKIWLDWRFIDFLHEPKSIKSLQRRCNLLRLTIRPKQQHAAIQTIGKFQKFVKV